MNKDLETIIEPKAAAIERSKASFEKTVVSALRKHLVIRPHLLRASSVRPE
jgi:hypothetical protein